MTLRQVYIRGHGWEEKNKPLPPSKDLPIDLVTIGTMGCTMSGLVADTVISQHWNVAQLRSAAENAQLIYWTHEERSLWERYGGHPQFEKPSVDIHMYSAMSPNLCLGGDDSLNNLPGFPTLDKCGLCHWDTQQGELKWILTLKDRQAIALAEILEYLEYMLRGTQDSVQLYWTACMDAKYWSGTRRAVSFYP